MKITIRSANNGDTSQIANLCRMHDEYNQTLEKYHRIDFDTAEFHERCIAGMMLRENAKLLVAEFDGRIVGYMSGTLQQSAQMPSEIAGMLYDAFVLEDFRHEGVCRRLFCEIEHWLALNCASYIELSFDMRNELARKFWGNMGFRPVRGAGRFKQIIRKEIAQSLTATESE